MVFEVQDAGSKNWRISRRKTRNACSVDACAGAGGKRFTLLL